MGNLSGAESALCVYLKNRCFIRLLLNAVAQVSGVPEAVCNEIEDFCPPQQLKRCVHEPATQKLHSWQFLLNIVVLAGSRDGTHDASMINNLFHVDDPHKGHELC